MLKEWCSRHGFLGGQGCSHVLMDGGTLNIPFDKLHEFYNTYIQSIKNGEHLFVVEQKTPVYNFFLDVDYNDAEPLSLDAIKTISIDICAKVESLGLPSRCLISVAKPKQKNGKIKSGIHYNWPDLPVTQEGALHMMYHIISSLNLTRDEDWSHYIDQSVYGDLTTGSKGSGFRMPWSHKKGKHAECSGKGCIVCNHTGKLTEVAYLPLFVYLDGIQPYSMEPTVEGLFMATVRTEQDPIDIPTSNVTFKKHKKEGTFTSLQRKNEVTNSEMKAEIESFIRINIPNQKHLRIRKIFKYKNDYLIETTSKFCSNIGREHNSNHVWFKISDKIIVQKCFCRCETMEGRRNGFCKDYSSRGHQLTKSIVTLLKH